MSGEDERGGVGWCGRGRAECGGERVQEGEEEEAGQGGEDGVEDEVG